MSARSEGTKKQTSADEQLDAAVLFVQRVGGVTQAKQALEHLRKLRKTG